MATGYKPPLRAADVNIEVCTDVPWLVKRNAANNNSL